MKQKDLLNLFYKNNWRVLREGSNHIIVTNGTDIEAVPFVTRKSTSSWQKPSSNAETGFRRISE